MNTLKNIEKELNYTKTENEDIAYKSTLNKNLDLFGLMGSVERGSTNLLKLFVDAYEENQELAIRNLFYLRDIRSGMGERKSFRKILEWLAKNNSTAITNIIHHIPQYGRWDDILLLIENTQTKSATIKFINEQLQKDKNSDTPSLLAKWLPSNNTSNKKSRKLALIISDELNLTPKNYRQLLSSLRKKIGIIETKLTERQYDFNYSKVPSQAMHKYTAAFFRNDRVRYQEYLEKLTRGHASINVGTLFPHQIISQYLNSILYNNYQEYEPHRIKLMEEQWKALKRNTTDKNTIVVRDGSGSMYGLPINIATALAILYSEQLKGDFKDKFITFSSKPQLVSLRHLESLKNKLDELVNYNDYTNTNIEKVYKLILKASKNVPKEDQIDKILIISDMEFDVSSVYDYGNIDIDLSTYENIKKAYKKKNVKMPEIVFWNVAARNIHFPTTKKDKVKLISGFSNNILLDILNDETPNALEFMKKCLEKYKEVSDDFIKEKER